MKNQLFFGLFTLLGCYSIIANSTPNKGQFDAWVNEVGSQARGSVTQEALEKGITGYLNHCGGGSCSCVLGIFDLDRSNSEERLVFIDIRNKQVLGATKAGHGAGVGPANQSSVEASSHGLDTYMRQGNVGGSNFTPLGFARLATPCSHGATTMQSFLSGRNASAYQSTINEYESIFGTMDYKIMAGVVLNGLSPSNRAAAGRQIMLHEGTHCHRGSCLNTNGCIVPPLRAQRSLCENIINKSRVILYVHMGGYQEPKINWQSAYPKLEQVINGGFSCQGGGQAFASTPGGIASPPSSMTTRGTVDPDGGTFSLFGRGRGVITDGDANSTPFMGMAALATVGGGAALMAFSGDSEEKELPGGLESPQTSELLNTPQNRVTGGAHEYRMCQTMSSDNLCARVLSCRGQINLDDRYGQAGQAIAYASHSWTAGETELAAEEYRRSVQDCYAYDCLEQRDPKYICAGSSILNPGELSGALTKQTYDQRANCDVGTFETQDNVSCREALQDYDDFADAEVTLIDELEVENKIELDQLATGLQLSGDIQGDAAKVQRDSINLHAATMGRMAEFHAAKASVFAAHYNAFPTAEKLLEDCESRVSPYQNEGADGYLYIVSQYEPFITPKTFNPPIKESCSRVIARDQDILIRNDNSRNFVKTVVEESLAKEKRYSDLARELGDQSKSLSDLVGILNNSGVYRDMAKLQEQVEGCREMNCFGEKGRFGDSLSYNDGENSEVLNWRKRIMARMRSGAKNKGLLQEFTSLEGMKDRWKGQASKLNIYRNDIKKLLKGKDNIKISKIEGEEKVLVKSTKGPTGLTPMREIIDEVPTFYPRFKFWRDHDGVLKTPEGRAVRDPISGKKNSLFEIISLRYTKHFLAPKDKDMIQGKSFFKEK